MTELAQAWAVDSLESLLSKLRPPGEMEQPDTTPGPLFPSESHSLGIYKGRPWKVAGLGLWRQNKLLQTPAPAP